MDSYTSQLQEIKALVAAFDSSLKESCGLIYEDKTDDSQSITTKNRIGVLNILHPKQ